MQYKSIATCIYNINSTNSNTPFGKAKYGVNNMKSLHRWLILADKIKYLTKFEDLDIDLMKFQSKHPMQSKLV